MLLKRKRLKKGTARDIILSSAESVFAENGYLGTTIDLIAQRAKVTKKLFYYHFSSKQDILIDIYNKHLQDVAEQVDDFFDITTDSVSEFISQFVDKLFNFLEGKQNIIKIFAIEQVTEPSNAMLLKILEPIRILFTTKMKQLNLIAENQNELDMKINQLFLGFVPIFTYFAFNDSLAQYYNINKDELKAKFTALFKNTMLANLNLKGESF